MNIFQAVILIALIGNTALGLFVLLSNPKRVLNIGFSILSFLIFIWLGSLFFASTQHSEVALLFWVRQTSSAAGMLPIGFFFIYIAVTNPEITTPQTFYKLRYCLLACFSIVAVCYSPVFALSATPATETQMVPPSEYGWGFLLYIAFFMAVMLTMIFGFIKAFKRSTGVQKVELQFLQIGGCTSLFFGVSLLSASVFFENQELGRFVPLSVLLLDGFVAYGIATRRIMAASVVLQRVVAYILMSCYLIVVYIVVEKIGGHLFLWLVSDTTYLSHLLAALVVAFSVIPAHGWVHVFSRRLFSMDSLNADEILARAGAIFREMSTEAKLMESFSRLISKTFETTEVVLLRPVEGNGYTQCYPASTVEESIFLERGSSVVKLLAREHKPFAVETLERMRPTALVNGALEEMKSADAAIILGSFSRNEIKAVLVLASKRSGRIYDLREQRALQLLSDQLAVAIDNARLYTEVQDGKIYNDILLDSLSSGILTVNEDRKVTVFNQRAQKLTGLSEADVVGKSVEVLPSDLMNAISGIFKNSEGFRDRDLSIDAGKETIPIRASGSVFHGHTGEMLGVLILFYDMTTLKKMEEQIRRADRLSSIGTLSAGMAHEIKNPLVTIKTFTQLLPHQHNNEDFQNTFFDLVGQEVKRIDTIVNRLLNFARPAKAALKPVSLHETLENSLRLVEQQLAQEDISLELDLSARQHIVEADAEQLNQTFINFFLNAIHAMEQGGTLSVQTSLVQSSVRLDIRDTGCGIPSDQIEHIFDPFFTTKEDGVGLGLSVSHGIIQEHSGTINVESEKGKGTVFHLSFPLMKTKETPV